MNDITTFQEIDHEVKQRQDLTNDLLRQIIARADCLLNCDKVAEAHEILHSVAGLDI